MSERSRPSSESANVRSYSQVVEKTKTVNAGYAKCDDAMTQFKLGTLACSPGCNAEQTIEATMTGELNKIREAAGNVCIRELPWLYNSPLIMASCGSKGSTINISQMIACVGQQAVGGVSRLAAHTYLLELS